MNKFGHFLGQAFAAIIACCAAAIVIALTVALVMRIV